MAFARSTVPEAFSNGASVAATTRLQPTRPLYVNPATTRAPFGTAKFNGRYPSPPSVAVSAAPVISERVEKFQPPSTRTQFDRKVNSLKIQFPELCVLGFASISE